MITFFLILNLINLLLYRLVVQKVQTNGEATWAPEDISPADGVSIVGQMGVGLEPEATLGAWDPQVLATFGPLIGDMNTENGTPADFVVLSSYVTSNPYVYDFVKGGIRGQLLAAPQFWVSFNTDNTGQENVGTLILTYRNVEVSVYSFVGMLQSQS